MFRDPKCAGRWLSKSGKERSSAENEKVLQDLLKRVEALDKKMPEDRLTPGVMRGSMDYTLGAFPNLCFGKTLRSRLSVASL